MNREIILFLIYILFLLSPVRQRPLPPSYDPPGLPEPGSKAASIVLPEKAGNENGSEFTGHIAVSEWGIKDAKSLEGELKLPTGVACESVKAVTGFTGGAASFENRSGILAFKYEATGEAVVGFESPAYPAYIFEIAFKLEKEFADGSEIEFEFNSLKAAYKGTSQPFSYGIKDKKVKVLLKGGTQPDPNPDPDPNEEIDRKAKIQLDKSEDTGLKTNKITGSLSMTGWGLKGVSSLEAVVSLPDGIKAVSAVPQSSLSGGALEYTQTGGSVIVAYKASEGGSVSYAKSDPNIEYNDIFSIILELDKNFSAGDKAEITFDRLKAVNSNGTCEWSISPNKAEIAFTGETGPGPGPGPDPGGDGDENENHNRKAYLAMQQEETNGQFSGSIYLEGWGLSSAQYIEAVIGVPQGITTEAVTFGTSFSGGQAQFSQDSSGSLRVVYGSGNGEKINFSSSRFDALALTINFTVTGEFPEGSEAVFALKSLRVLTSSRLLGGSPQPGGTEIQGIGKAYPFEIDLQKCQLKVKINGHHSSSFAVKAYELFIGDGVDILENGEKGVAFVLTHLPYTHSEGTSASGLSYKGEELRFSPELSKIANHPVYAALIGREALTSLSSLAESDFISSGTAKTLTFGSLSDEPKAINAQDALNTLLIWSRKTQSPGKYMKLAANVDANGKIDAADAVYILEKFVSGREFLVIEGPWQQRPLN